MRKGLGGIFRRVKSWGQRAADFAGRDLCLGIFSRAFGVGASEIGIHAVDVAEAPVVAHMIVVGVGVQHADGKTGQAFDYFANVADAHAGIEQQGSRLPQDQVGNYFFRLMGFIDGENARTNPVSLKPRDPRWRPFPKYGKRGGEASDTTPGFVAQLAKRPAQ